MTATPHLHDPARSAGSVPAPTPDLLDERRLLGAGLLLGLLTLLATAFIVVFFATSHPPMDATPVEAAEGFRDAAGMVGVGTWLSLLSLPLGLLFLGGLSSVLHRAQGWPTAATALLSGGAAFLVSAMGSVVSAITPTIGTEDTSAAAGAVVKALDGVQPLSVAASGFPRAALVAVTVLALSRTAAIGHGLTRFSWMLVALSLLGTGTFLSVALFPLAALSGLLFAGWIAWVAVVLRRRLAA